jgi:subtilisin family serine protease
MNVLFSTLTFVLALVSASPAPSKLSAGKYIIRFKSASGSTAFSSVLDHHNSFNPDANAVKHEYTIFPGVAGSFSAEFLHDLQSKHGNEIAYIEKSGLVKAVGSQPSPPSWGLGRVSQRTLKSGAAYNYPDTAGAGVDIYVIDTGIQASHSDFEGRAKFVKNFITEVDGDSNGHGTHCSGTIASKSYGVAKRANVNGIKVLNATGYGEDADVVKAIDWITQQPFKPYRTVISMSIGGDKLQSITDAVEAAFQKGIVSVVAAGNESTDACNGSPASAPSAITVGATGSTDSKAFYSNFGKCVDVFAPGSSIKSLWIGRDGATNTISGTSMATPHVAGVVALFMGEKDYASSQEVVDAVIKAGTKGVVKGLDADTVNLMVYNSATTQEQ